MKDCQKCKDYRDCPGRPWFHYGEVRWCPYQVIWIIEHVDTLRAGNWPPNPDGSSYIDPMIKTGFKDEAYYTKPIEILAEVELRLEKTGAHGRQLIKEIEEGRPLDLLGDVARSALMYTKGQRLKRMTYKTWLKQRTYRKNGSN